MLLAERYHLVGSSLPELLEIVSVTLKSCPVLASHPNTTAWKNSCDSMVEVG